MPTVMVNPTKVSEALQRLLSYSVHPFAKGEPKASIPVPMFGVLVLASLSKHVAAGRVAPGGTQSLHGLLVPYFKRIPLTEIARAYAEAYRKHVARDGRRFENLEFADYVAKVIELPIGQCLESLWQNSLLPPALVVPPMSAPPTVLYRRIRANIDELKCYKPEEIGSDEIYILTGGSIYDRTGPWNPPQTGHSKVYTGINDKHNIVPLTATESMILNLPARNGPDSPDSPTAMCTVTVAEHEYGDIDRVVAAFEAAYRVGQIIAAVAAATGPAGVAVAVALALPGLLQELAVLLDGDDTLGTAAFRFDHFCDGANWEKHLSELIMGPHLLSAYSYGMKITARTQDEQGPVPGIFIEGPTQLTSSGATGNASYRIKDCLTTIDHIEWSVQWTGVAQVPDATPTIYSGQGTRAIGVKFTFPGHYKVSVSARDVADGRSLGNSRPVTFKAYTSTQLNDSHMEIQDL